MKEQAFRADAREAKGLHGGSITRVVRVVERAHFRHPLHEDHNYQLDAEVRVGGKLCCGLLDQGRTIVDGVGSGAAIGCPFGVVGDRLWVGEEYCKGEYFTEEGELWYRTRPEDEHCFNEGEGSACDSGWHPADEMPRWASRTLLDVTDVRVVRAQEVTGQDMRAAGMTFGCRWCTAPGACAVREVCEHPRDEFRELVGRAVFDANRWLWLGTVQKVD